MQVLREVLLFEACPQMISSFMQRTQRVSHEPRKVAGVVPAKSLCDVRGGDDVDLRICRQYSTSRDAGGLLINANTRRSNSHASCQHSSSSNRFATMVNEGARLVPILEPGRAPGTRNQNLDQNQNPEPEQEP